MTQAALGDLVIRMAADVAQFQSDMNKAVNLAQTTSSRITRAFSTVRNVAGVALAGFSVNEIIKRTTDAERSLYRLDAVLKTTGFSAGFTADQINKMAEELKATTPFDDDDIRKGIAGLLRFRDVQGEVFEQAVRLAPDLATALDTDLASAFQKLGRALADPATGMRGLRDAGVKLSEEQIKQARIMKELGDVAGASKIVLDALRKSIGGAAAGENQGLVKSTADLGKAYDDLLKAIGRTPVVMGTTNSFYDFLAQTMKDLEQIITRGDWVEKLLAIGAMSAGFRGIQLSEPTKAGPNDGRIAEILKELDVARAQLRSGTLNPPGANSSIFSFLIPDVKLGEEQLAKIRATIDQLEAELKRLKQGNGIRPIGGIKTEEQKAAEGKAARDEERRLELEAKRREVMLKRDAALSKQAADDMLADEKALATERTQILEQYNSQSLIGIRDYYNVRRTIVQQELAGELAAIQRSMEEESKALAKANSEAEWDKAITALTNINKLYAERERLTRAAATTTISLNMQETAALEQLERKLREINIQIQEMEGRTVSAAGARFREQNKDLIKDIRANFGMNSPQEAEVKRLENLTIAQAQANKISEDTSIINQRLQIEEERIQNTRRVGAIGELTSMKQTAAARARAVELLEQQVVAWEEVAKASGSERMRVNAERARADLERLKTEVDLVGQAFDTVFREAGTSAFSDWVTGVKTAKEAFASFEKDVMSRITRMVTDELWTTLFGGPGRGPGGILGGILTGSGSGGTSGGSGFVQGEWDWMERGGFMNGGILNWIFGGMGGRKPGMVPGYAGGMFDLSKFSLSNLLPFSFGGGAGATDFAGSSFIMDMLGNYVPMLDSGTDYVKRSGLAMIHEGEAVVTKEENETGGRMKVEQHFHFAAPTDNRTQLQVGVEAQMGLDRARRNR